jgi:DNA ligase-1
MLLNRVVEVSGAVSQTTSRLEKIRLLADLLRTVPLEEVEAVVSWLTGVLRQGKLGIGYARLRDARTTPSLQPQLTVRDVDETFDRMAAASPQGRRELLAALFQRATAEEQAFLFRLLIGELRQGALEGIMADAIAEAAGLRSEAIRRAAMLAGELTKVARAVLESGHAGLAAFGVQLFRPVQPMLAQSADDATQAIQWLGEAALEYKFDGARIQVHRAGDDVRIFSRSLNDVTAAAPEVVEAVRRLPGRELILEGEVLALTPDGRPQPFQVTMRRFGRKLEVERMRSQLPLTPYWFDLLYLDGTSFIDEPQQRRFAALAEIVPRSNLTPYCVTADAARAEEFLHQALASGHEGIMAKGLQAPYAAGARGRSWLKIKRAKTLDLVILAAEWGSGRRRGWLSNLHLGARDAERGGFQMLGKTFKGLTDEMLEWQTRELLKLAVARDQHTVYVQPKLVVEIAFNDIQISPHYKSGLALRFARVKRYRPDKSPAEADTYATVKRLAGLVDPEADGLE